MKEILLRPHIQIQKSSLLQEGYGVFATREFAVGDTIEECYTLVVCSSDIAILRNFSFIWPAHPEGSVAVPLGYGCIYNHSSQPNAHFELDVCNKLIIFKATKTIRENEEIFISYGENWFMQRNMESLEPPNTGTFSSNNLLMVAIAKTNKK